MSLIEELREGPTVVERLLDEGREDVRRLASEIRRRDIANVLIAARGTSDHAAIYAQYVFGARNALPVALAAPSLVSVYHRPPRLRDTVVIGISQSGRSPDIVAVLEDARSQGALTAALTNDEASDLARTADHLIALRAGPEKATAATKTYLAEIAALAMLSAALDGDETGDAELRALPASLHAALDLEGRAAELASARAGIDRCAVLGRGFQYATAREWALKLKEMTYVLADPYSAADFQHGPVALVEADFPVLAVATSGAVLDGMVELIERVRAERANLLVASDLPEVIGDGDGFLLPSAPEG
ncbi:MAG TPA: SIS domain-containing protein, partial [Candidatus Limnocylindrales bacterium]